jgi:hypothetical protein
MRRIYVARPKKTWTRPESVIERRVDPATGLLLPEGCKPKRGVADHELFLTYAQPASTCPRGKPEHEANAFDHAWAWVRATWHHAGDWIASHFGEEEERKPRKGERYLGVPKLPQSAEVSAPVEEPKLLGVPVDSLIDSITPPPPPTADPETMLVDTILDEDTLGTSLLPLPAHR